MATLSIPIRAMDGTTQYLQLVPTGAADGQGNPLYGKLAGHTSQAVSQPSQTSTASFVDVAGCTLDSIANIVASYTIVNLDVANALTWQILAANQPDFSDSVVVKAPASVAASGKDSYTTNPALYRYYKPQIEDTVGGSHAAAKVAGIARG